MHRVGEKRNIRPRNIVAKFSLFKERELVRKSGSSLKGTNYYLNKQFAKRKELLPKKKEARRNGRKKQNLSKKGERYSSNKDNESKTTQKSTGAAGSKSKSLPSSSTSGVTYC
ncbi:hypothetical protein ACF0H5_009779 [Mactra antiquata]